MKVITIAGRTGKAGELRRTNSGEPVLSFSVAVDDGYGENKSTLWFDCSVWGKRAGALEPHITKGAPITVSGDLGKREHDGKTYLTIRVSEVTLQGGRPGERQESSRSAPSGSRPAALDDDEIPFAAEFR